MIFEIVTSARCAELKSVQLKTKTSEMLNVCNDKKDRNCGLIDHGSLIKAHKGETFEVNILIHTHTRVLIK